MTTAAGYFDRKPSANVRPRLSHLQADPSSPHTPQRTFSSAFSSPSLSYRAEEEALIFEFGTRHLSAGFAGESYPRCTLGFGPEDSRRVGDYRRWMPGYEERPRKRSRVSKWGEEYELWRMDLRGFDLGIVDDKSERAVREAYNKFLLLDSKSRKLLLILPSVLPHQLLDTILHLLFENFQLPTITLLSPPILSAVSAGCRSSLNVDIGWRETIVTAVYEYREVSRSRTSRAMRTVTLEMAKLLAWWENGSHKAPAVVGSMAGSEDSGEGLVDVDLDQAEEVTVRMAWCRRGAPAKPTKPPDSIPPMEQLSITETEIGARRHEQSAENNTFVSIPSPSSPRKSFQLPFSALSDPVETCLLSTPADPRQLDDHEQPLHLVIYKELLHLPPDIRSVCMSRIMFTGGGSNIPGLKSRLLEEVSTLVEHRGWDPVVGKAADLRRSRLQEASNHWRPQEGKPGMISKGPPVAPPASSASEEPQVPDPIEEKLRREQEKGSKPTVSGAIGGVETLGAWAGASLLAGLRIKGIVEIEKDVYLQYGLAGARKEVETNAQPAKSYGPGMPRPGERTSWTLGGWA